MGARSEETSAVHSSGEPVATKLHRIAEKARKEPEFKFTSLYHLMNEELLRGCFMRLRKDAAAGIDKMTKDMYAENLDANLSSLIDRLHRMAYMPQPVRRKYIPKPGSTKQRPLGIPTVSDRVAQMVVKIHFEPTVEPFFHKDSYGYRPRKSAIQAIEIIRKRCWRYDWLLEFDIKGLFDNVNQEWLMKVYCKRCTGFARLIRYADDFVVCFQYKSDAERFREELGKRLGKFGLEVEPTKTKVMEFGRFAVQNAKRRGGRAEALDFLGLTHYCGTRKDGTGFRMKRITACKKFVAKLKIFKEWLKKARNQKTKDLWKTAIAKLRGHYNYYGVTDNLRGIARFR